MCIGAEIPDIQGRIFQFEDASSTLIFQFSYFFFQYFYPNLNKSRNSKVWECPNHLE